MKNKSKVKDKKSPILRTATAVWFAVIVLKILEFPQIFKLLYFKKDFYYIAPTSRSIILFVFSIIIELILLFYIFNKNSCKPVIIVFIAVLLLFLNTICFSSYEYISPTEIKLTQSISYEDVDSVAVSVERYALPTGAKRLYTEWLVECKIQSADSETVITSAEFFDLDKLNQFLNKFSSETVTVDKSNADKIIDDLRRKSLFNANFERDIDSINQIFYS